MKDYTTRRTQVGRTEIISNLYKNVIKCIITIQNSSITTIAPEPDLAARSAISIFILNDPWADTSRHASIEEILQNTTDILIYFLLLTTTEIILQYCKIIILHMTKSEPAWDAYFQFIHNLHWYQCTYPNWTVCPSKEYYNIPNHRLLF